MLLPTGPGWKRNQILQIQCPTKMLLGIRGLARSDQKLSGEELHSLHSNYTWDYISLEEVPTGVNPIQFIRSIGLERPKAVWAGRSCIQCTRTTHGITLAWKTFQLVSSLSSSIFVFKTKVLPGGGIRHCIPKPRS